MKETKGITLIALIVVVTVVLILVAMAIRFSADSGVVDTTDQAATDYMRAKKKEENMRGEIEKDGIVYADPYEYVNRGLCADGVRVSEISMTTAEMNEYFRNVRNYLLDWAMNHSKPVSSEIDVVFEKALGNSANVTLNIQNKLYVCTSVSVETDAETGDARVVVGTGSLKTIDGSPIIGNLTYRGNPYNHEYENRFREVLETLNTGAVNYLINY